MNNNYEVLDIPINNVKRKKPILNVILALIIIILIIIVIVQNNMLKEVKNDDKSSNNTNNTSVSNTLDDNINNKELPFTSNEINTFEVGALNVTGKSNGLSTTTNYIDDYNAKYAFAYTVALNKIEYKMVDSNEQDLTGSARFNLEEFKKVYSDLYDEEFDISKLRESSSIYNQMGFPIIKNNYLYGSFSTRSDNTKSMEYRYINYDLDEKRKEYTLNFNALYYDTYEGKEAYIYMGTLKIKFKLEDNKKTKMISIYYFNEY